MRLIFVLFLLFVVSLLKGQEKSPELITDRPDQTESSEIVPMKSLQIETGFFMENNTVNSISQKSFAYNSTLFRYGLLENFELRLGIEYLGEEGNIESLNLTQSSNGFGPIYTGFKVKIAEEQGIWPEIAFLGGLVFPFTADEYFKPEYTAADIRFAFSHTISERFSLGYNLGAEWDGNSPITGYFYSMALGIGITEKFGAFTESFGVFQEEGEAEHFFDTGFTYLVLSNLQLDVSGGIRLSEIAADNFIGFGITYRIPN